MAYEFKKITEVDTLDSTPDNAHFFAEVDGAVRRIPKEFVSGGAGGGNVTTPDFAQNNEFASDFIKNRTHYSYGYENENEVSVTFDSSILDNFYNFIIQSGVYYVRLSEIPIDIDAIAGREYSYYSFEDETIHTATFLKEDFIPLNEITENYFPRVDGWIYTGDYGELLSIKDEMSSEGITMTPGLWVLYFDGIQAFDGQFTEISFVEREERVKHIDAKYIPRSIAKYSDLRLENLNDITVPHVLYGWYADDDYSTKVDLPALEEEPSNPMEAISSLVRITSSCDSDDIENVIDYGYLTGSMYEEGVRVPMSAKKIEADDLESPIEGVYVLQNALYFVTIDSFDLAEGVTLTKGVWCPNFNDMNNHPDNPGFMYIDSFNIVTAQSLIPSEMIDESIARVYDIEKAVYSIGTYMGLVMEEIGSGFQSMPHDEVGDEICSEEITTRSLEENGFAPIVCGDIISLVEDELQIGEWYKVTFQGDEYILQCKADPRDNNNYGWRYLGNIYMHILQSWQANNNDSEAEVITQLETLGIQDTEEPFCISTNHSVFVSGDYEFNTEAVGTYSVIVSPIIVHTLLDRHIPDTVLRKGDDVYYPDNIIYGVYQDQTYETTVAMAGGVAPYLAKVSDNIVSKEEIAGKTFRMTSGNQSQALILPSSQIQDIEGTENYIVAGGLLVVIKSGTYDITEGVTLTTGVWMPYGVSESDGMNFDSLEIYTPGKLISEDVLPNTVALLSDIPEAIPVPATATVGQMIVVKAVDESGKPTEWEAVDTPKAIAVADAAGETVTAAEYNALLAALRDAGLIAI